jgi:hypothetical protein
MVGHHDKLKCRQLRYVSESYHKAAQLLCMLQAVFKKVVDNHALLLGRGIPHCIAAHAVHYLQELACPFGLRMSAGKLPK